MIVLAIQISLILQCMKKKIYKKSVIMCQRQHSDQVLYLSSNLSGQYSS